MAVGETCLNCGAVLHGPYCAHCTQRHALPADLGIRGMMAEGPRVLWRKLLVFRDTPWLLFRPGFLLREYLAGRRVRHAHPWGMWATWWAVALAVTGLVAESDVEWLEEMLSPEFVAAATPVQMTRLLWVSWLAGVLGKAAESLAVVAVMPTLFRLLLGPDSRGLLPYTVLALHIAAFSAVLEVPLAVAFEVLEYGSSAVFVGGVSFLALGTMSIQALYVACSVRWGLDRTWLAGGFAGVGYVGLLYTTAVVLVMLGMVVFWSLVWAIVSL